MSFQNPGILYGLILTALPLIIHLINLRKYRKMYFSSLWFLKNIQYQTRRSRKIHEWIILLLRTLFIASLVIAFAGPYISEKPEQSGQSLHLIVDNTQSMQGSNRNGNLFDQAKEKCYAVLEELEGNQRINLHYTNSENSHWNVPAQKAKNIITATEIGHGTRKINTIVKEIYEKQKRAPSLIILSDFQKNVLQPDTIFQDSNLMINLVKYANQSNNISIDTMWFDTPLQIPGQSTELHILIRNHAKTEVNDLPVQVKIDGNLLSAGTVNIEPQSHKVYKTSMEIEDLGLLKISASISNNPITFDNTYYSGIGVSQKISIIETGKNPSPYLKALYNDPQFFEHRFLPADNLPLSEINQAQTIIVHQPANLSAGLANAINQAVSNGKNLLILPRVNETTMEINELMDMFGLPQMDKTIQDSTKIEEINLSHPLFVNAIDEFDEEMSLPYIGNYYRLSSENIFSPVMYNDLKQGVLFHMKKGNGNVYMFTFNALKKEFATHPLFVPIFYNGAAIRNKNIAPAITCNKASTIRLSNISKRDESPLKIKHANGEFIPYMYKNQNAIILAIRQNQIQQPGFYDIVLKDSTVNLLAANHQTGESIMDFYSTENLEKQIFKSNPLSIFDIDATAREILNPVQKLWRYFIIIALIMILAEIALIIFKEKSYKT